MPSRLTPPTRHALLETKEELETARSGLDILERRRKGIVTLVRELLERWKALNQSLEDAFGDARRIRTKALEYDGIVALDSTSRARNDHLELLLLTQELEGLPVPFILSRGVTKRIDQRGYGILGTTSALDETAASHERVLELVIRQAELQLTLRILLSEVRRLGIRVNALRHKLIPELEETKRYVELHLAEREREERLIQRFMKRKREASRDQEMH